MASTLCVAVLDLALFATGVALLWWALRQRWPTRRRLAVASVLTAGVAAPAWYASARLF